jgi:hypothetical protein
MQNMYRGIWYIHTVVGKYSMGGFGIKLAICKYIFVLVHIHPCKHNFTYLTLYMQRTCVFLQCGEMQISQYIQMYMHCVCRLFAPCGFCTLARWRWNRGVCFWARWRWVSALMLVLSVQGHHLGLPTGRGLSEVGVPFFVEMKSEGGVLWRGNLWGD